MKQIKFPFVFFACILLIVFFILGIFVGKNSTRNTMYVMEASTLPPEVTLESSPQSAEQETESIKDKLNINTATAQELDDLPGIGEVIAQRIVDYRLEHGYFLSIDELMEVNGIGEKMFAEIRDLITVR